MSTTHLTPPVVTALPSHERSKAAWPRWTREPLLHFLIIGGLLFAADHVLSSRLEDPHTIVMGREVDNEARQVFKASRGRDPHADELAALRQVWLDNEVLYREGLALQLDKGDTAIRDRVIFKALSMVDSNTRLPTHDDKTLRSWFEQHRGKYDEPARYDFQEAVLSGDASEAAVRAFVANLNAGALGDANAGLRVFKGRPQANLVQSYGADFARAMQGATVGEWRAMPTKEGWRAIRLDAVASPKPAAFEALRGVIMQDWTDAVMADQRTAAVRALAKKYTVKTEATQ